MPWKKEKKKKKKKGTNKDAARIHPPADPHAVTEGGGGEWRLPSDQSQGGREGEESPQKDVFLN